MRSFYFFLFWVNLYHVNFDDILQELVEAVPKFDNLMRSFVEDILLGFTHACAKKWTN